MKTFFSNKILTVLLFTLVSVGTFTIINSIYPTTVRAVEKTEPQYQELLTHNDIMQVVDDLNKSNTNSQQPKYVLRSQENEHPMGYVDSTLIRCFVDMSPVDFLPRYKYYEVGGNGSSMRLYGFSIPLVGDLNGDGKPEIVALGYNGTSVNSDSEDLYVFNGQTGEVIVKFHLPATTTVATAGAYHGSPSQLALVDADRNGKGEIIFAFNNSSGNWRKKVVSWEVNEKTFDSKYSVTDNSKLTHKWTSSVRYDDSSNAGTRVYDYPMPQVVDIDGDGVPEVIVYNKVYSALTGDLLVTLESLGTTINNKTAYIGSSGNEIAYNEFYIAFPMIYDIDGDGKYDYLAGGKIYYDINPVTGTYKILNYSSQVKDGRTAVADVNGDGKPDIVVTNYLTKTGTGGVLQMTVWNPDFINNKGEIIAQTSFPTYNSPAQGNHSYIFIGDIDGKQQNGKKYPEISILTSRPYVTARVLPMKNIPVHPNVTDGGIATNMNISASTVEGAIISFTWDNSPNLPVNDRLKVSFMLEHDDRSVNTGFTLFDFDNDGVQDICYRDEQTLRIISAKKSYVTLGETSTDVIRFKKSVFSFTGYEYPVIADVDGDASADMIVMGRSSGGTDNASGYIFAIEGANRDLAPAPKVWNQYMYSPLKINEDLTTPIRIINPLSEEYCYYKSESDIDPVFIYNNTITQVPFYSVVESGGKKIAKPIVRTPDAKLLQLGIDIAGKKLNFKLTNIGDATINPMVPIYIYQEGILKSTTTVGSGGCFAGDTISYSLTITDPYALYTIVVGATFEQNSKTFIPVDKYNDCNWADNMDEIATFLLKDDAATVVQYGSIVIDVLANDILLDACLVQNITKDILTTPGGVGVLSGDFGSVQIVNNKLLYTAPASYPGGVVKLSYKLTCSGAEKTANVYIYVLESCSFGFASCAGSPYNVCLKENPSGIKFGWYNSANDADYIGEESPNIPSLMTDMVYYVKPNFNMVSDSPYRLIQFPKGEITIKVLNSTEKLKAKWTGEVDSDWYNPGNWAQVLTNGSEIPVTWAPIGCVDVVIPSGAARYPELKSVAECSQIHMEDRAMISGIHNLAYAEASVDMMFTSSEKDRFVMWSAPLKDMYTGDYHFLNSTNQPDWGHVYMNFFQSANPDYAGSVEKEKTFTSTFGSTGTPLPLGKAFNVKVLSGVDQGFTFPKAADVYIDMNNTSTGNLSRMNAKRFITDGAINANGDITIPVSGNNKYSLIQVVNPFMAYLKVNEFLAANPYVIESSYSLWNGDVDAEFISILSLNEDENQRYVIDDISRLTYESTGYIAPLQSFFVKKRSSDMSITSLAMNASMTTTSIPNTQSSYVLRSAVRGGEVPDMLRITASSGGKENSTVILRKSGAKQAYSLEEDVEKVFNHGVPVSVYTMTSTKKALAINVSDNFSEDVKLGVRVRNTNSPVTLSFSGLKDFNQDVSLIDHALNDKEIDIQKENDYVFTVQQGSADVTEINDRFSLRFRSNSTGIKSVVNDEIKVVADKKRIDVSFSSIFDRVEIINLSGLRVYDSAIPASYCRIPVIGGQVYLVRVTVGGKHIVKKVYVK